MELKIECILGIYDKTPIVFPLFTFPVKCSLVRGITELGYWCLMLSVEALTAEWSCI